MSLDVLLWDALLAHVDSKLDRKSYPGLKRACKDLEQCLAHLPIVQDWLQERLAVHAAEIEGERARYLEAYAVAEAERAAAAKQQEEYTEKLRAWEASDERLRFAQQQMEILHAEMRGGSPYKYGTRAECLRAISSIATAALTGRATAPGATVGGAP